ERAGRSAPAAPWFHYRSDELLVLRDVTAPGEGAVIGNQPAALLHIVVERLESLRGPDVLLGIRIVPAARVIQQHDVVRLERREIAVIEILGHADIELARVLHQRA